MGKLTVIRGARRSGKSVFVNSLPPELTDYLYPSWAQAQYANKAYGRKERMIADMQLYPYHFHNKNTVIEEINYCFQFQLKRLLKMMSGNIYLTLTPRVVEIDDYDPERNSHIPFWLRLMWAKDTKIVSLPTPDYEPEHYSFLPDERAQSEMLGKVVLDNNGVYMVEGGNGVRRFQEYHSTKTIAEVILS